MIFMCVKCENCKSKHNGEYGSGRFCSPVCARGFSTKIKRVEINEKVSKKLKEKFPNTYEIIKCNYCEKLITKLRRKRGKYCSMSCSTKANWKNEEYRKRATEMSINRCSTQKEKNRMRDIGRNGGFGKRGYTKKGIYFQSSFEEKVFEYLDDKNIEYVPHKNIPNSSKISDIFIPNLNIWIELDGINREKRKKWLGKNYDYWIEKLGIYKSQNLNFKILYNIEEVKKFFDDNIFV